MNTDLKAVVSGLLQRDSQERMALGMLLDQYTHISGKLMVFRQEMGGSESYLASAPLAWVAQNVHFAFQLPLFRQKANPDSGEMEIDRETIDEVMQRQLDWTRQAVLAQYLAMRKNHKFPPLLLVATQAWVDDKKADEWGADGHAIRSAANFRALDSNGDIGLLDVEGDTSIYALDGQHRLLGIKGLMDLVSTGSLPIWDKKRNRQVDTLTIADLEKEGISATQLAKLAHERVGIELMSAVMPSETRPESKRRVRSIFVHVNMAAVKVTGGEGHQLDEDNGFAIIAKHVAVGHPMFLDGKGVNMKNNTIAERSTDFTTLQTLVAVAHGLLQARYARWKPEKKGLMPQRPDEAELDEAEKTLTDFFAQVGELPSVQRMLQGTGTPALRNFAEFEGEGHVLFRPVGQIALATAVGDLVYTRPGPTMTMVEVFRRLKRLDAAGTLSQIDAPSSPWWGVLYDSQRKRMLVAGLPLAMKLFTYLLGGGEPDETKREKLRSEFAAARTMANGKAMDLSGDEVDPATLMLPNPA